MTNLSVEAVLGAMAAYTEAVEAERKAYENYDGVSWGYHGERYLRAIKNAREEAQRVLDDYVEYKVNEALKAKGVV